MITDSGVGNGFPVQHQLCQLLHPRYPRRRIAGNAGVAGRSLVDLLHSPLVEYRPFTVILCSQLVGSIK